MLTRLVIDNYALIDKTEVEFREGFTVITGETGAGKSIMLGALSLLMGARADTKAMGNKERKTTVEATFINPDPSLASYMAENGLDWDERELIIRRELSPAGKSRGFINDTPVNLSILGEVSHRLLDIHTQHSNTLLSDPHSQLQLLDAFGNTSAELESYRKVFHEYVNLRNKIKRIRENIAKGKENREFLLFRLEQLDKLKPRKGELEELEREFEVLGDADRIKSDLQEAQTYLSGSTSALKQIQEASTTLNSVDFQLLDPQGDANLIERLDSIKIELRDISDTLEEYADKISSDPERYEKIRIRIEALEETMKRFKVKNEDELVELHIGLREELEGLTGDKTDLTEMESRLKELAKELKEKADRLSEERKEAAQRFSKILVEKIRPLGLPNVNFTVDIDKGKLSADGQDIVVFKCSFNKNHPMQPISEIASGGEISRVMLGIKSLMSDSRGLPTIIFDEIDTGVSGEIAHKMGKMMKEMSDVMQVMAVTHLPQVAANGQRHLKVYKADDKEKTVSHIKEIEGAEREKEIAGMLSGTTINDVALENARVLLNS